MTDPDLRAFLRCPEGEDQAFCLGPEGVAELVARSKGLLVRFRTDRAGIAEVGHGR